MNHHKAVLCQASRLYVFLASVEKEGTQAIIVPKTLVHLYRQKDPGKTSPFYFWFQFGVHLSTKKQWSPYPRPLTTYLAKHKDGVCKDTNFPQFNTDFHSPSVCT